jgi:hypothetical protein
MFLDLCHLGHSAYRDRIPRSELLVVRSGQIQRLLLDARKL